MFAEFKWIKKNNTENCYLSLAHSSDVEKYEYIMYRDENGISKKIRPIPVAPNFHAIPTNSSIEIKCNKMYLTFDGGDSFNGSCTPNEGLKIPTDYECLCKYFLVRITC